MERRRLLDEVMAAARRMTGQTTLFSEAVARRLALSSTDVETLEILIDTGALSAGRLAELTGLSSGAVSRLIDRLERAGYVRRIVDPDDRRRVIVEVVPDRVAAIADVFRSTANAASAELQRFSDTQLALVREFLERMEAVGRQELGKLGDLPLDEPPPATDGLSAPIGRATLGRLLFKNGAPRVRLTGDAGPELLYRARFEGRQPRIRVRDGSVSLEYAGIGFLSGGAARGEIALCDAIPWSIELRGGASHVEADLRPIELRAIELTGGLSRADVRLGRPGGHVPIRVTGGASDVLVRLPHATAVTLHIRGGVSKVELDGRSRGAMGGDVRLETDGAAAAGDRYEVELTGGASKVAIVREPA